MPIDFNLLKTLAGHGYDVNSVAFSRDSLLLASGGGDHTMRLWNVETFEQLVSSDHGDWINAVCFAPSGQAVASGARDGSVKLWNVENGQVLGTIQAHANNVSSIAFSPDGGRLVTGGGDGHVRVFNLKEKKLERDLEAHNGWVWCVAFSSLGDRILTCGSDGLARVWSADSGAMLVTLEGHAGDVLSGAFSPDDRFVATTCKDGSLHLWETESARMLFKIRAHEGAANAVAWPPDGLHIVTAGADHNINVWQVESAQKVRELTGHQDYVACVTFSRDGLEMASCGGDGTLKIWQVTERSAYAASSDTKDPDLEIEYDDASSRADSVVSAYAAGKKIAESTLKNGIRIALMQSALDKYSIAVGDAQRTAATITGDHVSVMSGSASLLFTYGLMRGTVIFDRTEGAAAPWNEEKDFSSAVAADPNLENATGADLTAAFGSDFELERHNAPSALRYESFEKLGKSLAKEPIGSSGRLLRMVQFDADTVYLLFDQLEEPTVVFKGEHLDVRDGSGHAVFRLNLRSLEPVIGRKRAPAVPGVETIPDSEFDIESLLGEPVLMTEQTRDPLLVHGLSEMEGEAGPKVNKILEKALWQKASDIHIPSGTQVLVRRHGRLTPLGVRSHTPVEIEMMVEEILTPDQWKHFDETGDLDFSYEIKGTGRFRGNVCRQHRGVDMTFRVIPDSIPDAESLGIPDAVIPLTKNHNGLILVTGPAGQGKSTTIAALVNLINEDRPQHIITVEDPIEFIYPHRKAVVNQREVGRHTHSFANALRASLREDPDVIVVGEMRDLETIALAISASETGHLVFGSLMTSSASQTIDRILDSFPSAQQSQIRTMLSESLRGIVSQQLVPTVDGEGRVLACEVLIGTPAVANLIRERKTFQLPSVLQTSRNIGMQRMDDALFEHVQAGRITPASALRFAQDPKGLETRLKPRAGGAEPAAPGAR